MSADINAMDLMTGPSTTSTTSTRSHRNLQPRPHRGPQLEHLRYIVINAMSWGRIWCPHTTRAQRHEKSNYQTSGMDFDKRHTDGVPDMTDRDRTRVSQANTLYMHTCESCAFLNDGDVAWTMEDLTNSWLGNFRAWSFWKIKCFTSFHS